MWIKDNILVCNINTNLNKKYWYEKIVSKHKDSVYEYGGGSNFLLTEEFDLFSKILIDIFHQKTKEKYVDFFGNYKILPKNKNLCWAYVSNKNEYRGGIHNHIETSTINSVYYFNMPSKHSGGISFFNENGKILTYQPKENDLLIFPNYLLHEPEKIDTEEYRISINMEIICRSV